MTIVSAVGAFGMLNRAREVEYKSFSVDWTWCFVLPEKRSFKATFKGRIQKRKTWSDHPACFWSWKPGAQSVSCPNPSYEDHIQHSWIQCLSQMAITDVIYGMMPEYAWLFAHNCDLWEIQLDPNLDVSLCKVLLRQCLFFVFFPPPLFILHISGTGLHEIFNQRKFASSSCLFV